MYFILTEHGRALTVIDSICTAVPSHCVRAIDSCVAVGAIDSCVAIRNRVAVRKHVAVRHRAADVIRRHDSKTDATQNAIIRRRKRKPERRTEKTLQPPGFMRIR